LTGRDRITEAVLAKAAIELHPLAFRADNVAVARIALVGVMMRQPDNLPNDAISVFRS
jgi:hypothetical protein